jgi:hypothetical protein
MMKTSDDVSGGRKAKTRGDGWVILLASHSPHVQPRRGSAYHIDLPRGSAVYIVWENRTAPALTCHVACARRSSVIDTGHMNKHCHSRCALRLGLNSEEPDAGSST